MSETIYNVGTMEPSILQSLKTLEKNMNDTLLLSSSSNYSSPMVRALQGSLFNQEESELFTVDRDGLGDYHYLLITPQTADFIYHDFVSKSISIGYNKNLLAMDAAHINNSYKKYDIYMENLSKGMRGNDVVLVYLNNKREATDFWSYYDQLESATTISYVDRMAALQTIYESHQKEFVKYQQDSIAFTKILFETLTSPVFKGTTYSEEHNVIDLGTKSSQELTDGILWEAAISIGLSLDKQMNANAMVTRGLDESQVRTVGEVLNILADNVSGYSDLESLPDEVQYSMDAQRETLHLITQQVPLGDRELGELIWQKD